MLGVGPEYNVEGKGKVGVEGAGVLVVGPTEVGALTGTGIVAAFSWTLTGGVPAFSTAFFGGAEDAAIAPAIALAAIVSQEPKTKGEKRDP